MGVATICIRVHILTENVGLFYSSSDGFLMILIQSVCIIAILCLRGYILYDGIIYSKTPSKGLI